MSRKRVVKKPIDPERIRAIPPEGFSWIDRRFVRDGFLEELPRETILLYFFLVSVSDSKGLSFYADPTISRLLELSAEELSQARSRLIGAGLILYRHPLYQVLPLPCARPPSQAASVPPPRRGGEPLSIGQFLASLAREANGRE